MGDNFINTVFAVVVIGGMGSIMGSIITGFALGVIEGLTKVFYPQASATVVFVVMVNHLWVVRAASRVQVRAPSWRPPSWNFPGTWSVVGRAE